MVYLMFRLRLTVRLQTTSLVDLQTNENQFHGPIWAKVCQAKVVPYKIKYLMFGLRFIVHVLTL